MVSRLEIILKILEETLLVIMLPAFHTSARKTQRVAPSLNLSIPESSALWIGRVLRSCLPQTFAWDNAFEHWVILAAIKNASYKPNHWTFSYARTKDNVVIDPITFRSCLKIQPIKVIWIFMKSSLIIISNIHKRQNDWLLNLVIRFLGV